MKTKAIFLEAGNVIRWGRTNYFVDYVQINETSVELFLINQNTGLYAPGAPIKFGANVEFAVVSIKAN